MSIENQPSRTSKEENVLNYASKENTVPSIKKYASKESSNKVKRSSINGKTISFTEGSTPERGSFSKKSTRREYSKVTTTAVAGSDEYSEERRLQTLGSDNSSSTIVSKGESIKSSERLKELTLQAISDTQISENQDLPNVGHDIRYTKLYLQKQGIQNLSMWSHLNELLNKVIAEQPDNVIDYFEEYSRKVKQERLIIQDSLRDVYVLSPHLESAQNQLYLMNEYGRKEEPEEPAVGEDEEAVVPPKRMDLEEAVFYFRHAGLVIPDIQLFNLNIAIKRLAEENNLQKFRFWGKIKGTKQDYFILESELTEEEYLKRAEEDELAEAAEAERLVAETDLVKEADEEGKSEEEVNELRTNVEEIRETEIKSEGEDMKEHITEEEEFIEKRKSNSDGVKFDLPEEGEDMVVEEEEDPLLPPLPQPKKLLKYKIPPFLQPIPKEIIKVPSEKIGQGVNKKIYFVSNTPELEWTQLPKVTPDEINTARQLKIYLSGDLEAPILTFPAFPGTEKNYLRAQIARISASTQVSPIGFYQFGEKGDEEEEEEVVEEEEETGPQTKVTENSKYQPIPLRDLTDPSLASWVHHSQYILKQGRTEWWNMKKVAADEEADEEEQEEEAEEEEKEGVAQEKETGPALLTPLSEDLTIEGLPAWTARKTHNYNNEMAVAFIKSNLWPGSYAFAIGKKFENVYFGWGHKHLPQGFSPALVPHPEYEYELGPEIMEIEDPTVEVEQAWRQEHKMKPPPVEGEEGEGEEGEEEEEEEEDDE